MFLATSDDKQANYIILCNSKYEYLCMDKSLLLICLTFSISIDSTIMPKMNKNSLSNFKTLSWSLIVFSFSDPKKLYKNKNI